jgi:PhnB protein
MKEINVYLTFDGNCRQAMQFYHKCLGGELQMLPFSEAPFESPAEAKDRIIHARITNGAAILMASDTMPGMPVNQGNNFSVSINCSSADEVERLFNALAEKGKVIMAVHDAFWGARFGMLTDQFGINWMFNFEQAKRG